MAQMDRRKVAQVDDFAVQWMPRMATVSGINRTSGIAERREGLDKANGRQPHCPLAKPLMAIYPPMR